MLNKNLEIMKKLFLGVTILASSLSFAQQFGIKAGANVSSISKEGFETTKAKAGFYAGVFMNAPVSEEFSIQPEVIYNNLGSKTTLKNSVLGTYESKLNLDYISVPIMVQYKATPEFYLEAGPELSFLVNASTKTTYNPALLGSSTKFSELDKDNYNSFNFGMGIGLGYNFTPNIGINARYVAGFTDLTKDGTTSLYNQKGNNRNNNFQVGLSYKF